MANVKHADQVVRSTTILPAGTGKTKRIAVFADGGQEAEAKKAGADVIGGEDLIEKVTKEKSISTLPLQRQNDAFARKSRSCFGSKRIDAFSKIGNRY